MVRVDNITVSIVRESMETLIPAGSITFVVDSNVYRAYLVNNNTQIFTKQIFTLPLTPDIIGDVIVHDNFTLIKFTNDNDTFQTFTRPRPEGTANVTRTRNGQLSINPPPDMIVYKVLQVLPTEPQKMFLYVLPNWQLYVNYLLIYNVT
jgi:hypothetical protein